MKKKVLSIILAVVMIAGIIPLSTMTAFAYSRDTEYSMANAAGEPDAIKWMFASDGTLEIYGVGAIPQMAFDEYPWYDKNFAANIKKLVIDEDITNLPNFYPYKVDYKGEKTLQEAWISKLNGIIIKSKHFDMDFSNAMNGQKNIKTITFAEGVESISITGSGTFSSCTVLTTVNLPSTLKSLSVHSQTFANDTAFKTITLAEGNEHFSLAGGALYNKEQTELILTPTGGTAVTPVSSTQRIKAGQNVDIKSMLKSTTALDTNIQITLKHNKDGKTPNNNQFYVGEMIKAEVTANEGELPDGLFYAWLGYNSSADRTNAKIDNAKTATIAGFETPDTYIDGDEYVVSPNALYGAVKITYFPYDSKKKGYYGTAYCRFAVCKVVDGWPKIVAYQDFTAKAESGTTSEYSYTEILNEITSNISVTMIKGEKRSVQELLGRCGLTHVTCSAITISDVTCGETSDEISVSGSNITAVDCVTNFNVTYKIKADNCLYHGTCERRSTILVTVIEDPQIEAKCTSVVVNNPADGYDYFIGQRKGEVTDGKVYFGGLTPETEYIVRMQITGEYGEATYTNAVKVKTPAHDFSDIRDNGNGTHSTYCVNGCGECVDTAEHNFDDGECTVCHATEHTIPETTYTIVIPKEVAVNSKGITAIGKPTVKDVENADGKIITYTAEGTDFTKSDDNSKIVKAAYYTAYTDADNNTPLGTESITVYDGGYIAEESLTALYVFISDDEWEKAENGIYHATVTYHFEAKEE